MWIKRETPSKEKSRLRLHNRVRKKKSPAAEGGAKFTCEVTNLRQ
jgi:hypothetical protein